MLRLIGSDGKEYGPITPDQLRQWIREGRAGGSTQVRREGDANWATLRSLAEFADIFQAPPTPNGGAGSGTLPPVVRTFGVLCLVFGVLSLLQYTVTWISLFQAIQRSPSFSPFNPTFLIFQFLGLAGVMIRFVGGAGLLRGREWARRLIVYYSVFAALLGLYGIGRNAFWFATSGSAAAALRSISVLTGLGYSGVLLVFHIAAVVCLSGKSVRETMKRSATVSS